jgi:serine phosphatase RsbU (regulator of sigma subunit)
MKFRIVVFFVVMFVCSLCKGSSQAAATRSTNKLIDSLVYAIKVADEDTVKLNSLNQLARQYILMSDLEKALTTAYQAKSMALELNASQALSLTYNIIGNVFYYRGEIDEAIVNYTSSLEIRKKIGDKKGIAGSYNNIGVIFHEQGNYEKAMENHFNSLAMKEEIGDTAGMSSCYSNIGRVFLVQKKYSKALIYYNKSLELERLINNKSGIALANANIGIIYNHLREYTNAMKSLSQSLLINQSLGDKRAIASVYINIANVYGVQGMYEKALYNQLKAANIYKEIDSKQGLALVYRNSGVSYTALNKLSEAKFYLNNSLIIETAFNNKVGIKDCYYELSNVYYKNADYFNAYKYRKMFESLKDSLFTIHSVKQVEEMSERYSSLKKDKELTEKELEIAKRQTETDKKQIQINVFIICCVLILLFAMFIYRAYRGKRIINEQLNDRNELIQVHKKSVEEINKNITASIAYAKRIQNAVIPSEEKFKLILPNSFVFFKPKDIVSGDFYWITEIEESTVNSRSVLLAVGDCVGHGVPGALMSLMSYNLLEQIVKDHKNYSPSLILDDMAEAVGKLLIDNDEKQSVKSGLDITLCKIDLQKMVLNYSGAQNSLYLVRNGNLIEYKADKRSIPSNVNSISFTSNEIPILTNDSFYMFTDGYADQKGGLDNKKLFYKPFQELLLQISHLSLIEQKTELDSFFTNWQGNNEQIDDVLVVGIKI